MKRRAVLASLATTLAPFAVRAQTSKNLPRVGILTPAASDQTTVFAAFRKGLADLGYVDGKTIALDYRFAKGDYETLPKFARELVDAAVDVIVTDTGPATVAAHKASRSIPIVMAAGPDPVTLGLAVSVSRPGGNVTGFSIRPAELIGKRMQLLNDAFPGLARVALLINPKQPIVPELLRNAQQAADRLHLELITIEAGDPDALRALRPASFAGADGLVVSADGMLWSQSRVIVALATAARLPAIYSEREFADAGGLIAFGPNIPDHFWRAAGYVVRVLKGAKPGDLPIEESAKFDFVVNLRTARALGLQLAPDFLSGVNEVIE